MTARLPALGLEVAVPSALALSEQDGGDDLAVAGCALLLASFDAGIRALLELRGGEGASALPVLVERRSDDHL